MRISVFGLGYVGVVSAACLARDGHHVIGVDPNPVKTALINEGKTPIVESFLEELIQSSKKNGRLRATDNVREAVDQAELMLICVGTPGQSNGSLDLSYVRRVCEEIGKELANQPYKVVVVRSTMLPGSMQSVVLPTLESCSGKRAGQGFGLCINPEFLREGTAIYDYDNPPKTIIGTTDSQAAALVEKIYSNLSAPVFVTDLSTAEMVKYVDNSWHALKVAFANEVGRFCKVQGVDSRLLMRLFCEDKKLNISPAYLRPGFAFGGSCLPKDVRALSYQGKLRDVNAPIMSAILASNRVHIDLALDMIMSTGKKRIGLLGLSFKEGTDDLRESPIVVLAERLLGKGYELAIFDRNVKLASLVGANRDYILNHIPHIGRLLLDTPEALFAASDTVVIATAEKDFGDCVTQFGSTKHIIDLVGIWGLSQESLKGHVERYEGITW
jgi:GDP-mannose 6-dehydrogenase